MVEVRSPQQAQEAAVEVREVGVPREVVDIDNVEVTRLRLHHNCVVGSGQRVLNGDWPAVKDLTCNVQCATSFAMPA